MLHLFGHNLAKGYARVGFREHTYFYPKLRLSIDGAHHNRASLPHLFVKFIADFYDTHNITQVYEMCMNHILGNVGLQEVPATPLLNICYSVYSIFQI